MKYKSFTLYSYCFLIMLTFSTMQAQTVPFENELRDRIPELPEGNSVLIKVNPVKPAIPVPEPPATIDPIETSRDGDSIKYVFWIHGFGGNRGSWTTARDASQNKNRNTQGFQARKLKGFAIGYLENGSLDLAARDVAREIKEEAEDQEEDTRKKNFIIGHSQGGILTRYIASIDACDEVSEAKGNYGGIVTFCSAMNGAQIINSRESGEMDNLATYLCNTIGNSLNLGLKAIILRSLFQDDNDNGIYNICDAFVEKLIPILFKKVNAQISNDYRVGSPEVDQMNSCTADSISKVAFYGIEPYAPIQGADFQNPIFYRTVQHFFGDVNEEDTWGANDDAALAIEFAKTANEHRQEAKKFVTRAGLSGIWNPGALGQNLLKARSQRELYYMYHNINSMWMSIIGANELAIIDTLSATTTNHPHCSCNINQGTWIQTVSIPNVTTANDCTHPQAVNCTFTEGLPITSYTFQWGHKPSDGVVLQESAQHMVGATWDSQRLRVIFTEEDDTGSSHMQARNDRNLRDALRKLFDGGYGKFYETEIKD